MLDVILSQVATGLVLGGLYVLIAIGLSIIFGLLGIVNFAHGNFFALGAYFALTLYQYLGWPGVLLAPLLVGAVGMVVEKTVIRQLYDKEPLISLIITFALALMIEALLRLVYGGIGQPFSQPPFLSGIYLWGPVLITKYRLTVFLTTVVLLIALWAFMQFTRTAASCGRVRAIRKWSASSAFACRACSPQCSASAAVSLASPACWPRRYGR